MNLTGRLVGASKDFKTGKMRIALEVNESEQVMKCFDKEKEYELDITLKKHTEKRSIGANALFHKWVDILATSVCNSREYVKNWLLYLYGEYETNDGQTVYLTIKTDDVGFWVNNGTVHVWPVRYYVDGTTQLVVLRHSKSLNSDEFRRLLDGTKYECENVGIDTISADEIAHIASLWKAEE